MLFQITLSDKFCSTFSWLKTRDFWHFSHSWSQLMTQSIRLFRSNSLRSSSQWSGRYLRPVGGLHLKTCAIHLWCYGHTPCGHSMGLPSVQRWAVNQFISPTLSVGQSLRRSREGLELEQIRYRLRRQRRFDLYLTRSDISTHQHRIDH